MERLNISYINEINAFHSWVQVNELPASAVVLWYSLMHYCNKTGWKKQFNIAISTLETDTKLKRSTIFKARSTLEKFGLISVIHRKGRQSAIYSLHPITDIFASIFQTQAETQNDFESTERTQSWTQNEVESTERTQSWTIPRLKTIDKTKDAVAPAPKKQEVAEYYQCNIHPFKNLNERDRLESLIDDYGPDYCRKAIDRAVYRKKRNLQYITGILQRWKQDGYDNPDGSSVRQDVPEEVRNIPF